MTFLQVLLAVLIGIAPIALTIAIKLILYRRRLAEDEALRDKDAKAIANSAERKSRRARPARRYRRMRLGRPLPYTLNSDRPLALFVTDSRGKSDTAFHNN